MITTHVIIVKSNLLPIARWAFSGCTLCGEMICRDHTSEENDLKYSKVVKEW
jgi:hypothetical protein